MTSKCVLELRELEPVYENQTSIMNHNNNLVFLPHAVTSIRSIALSLSVCVLYVLAATKAVNLEF